MKRKQKREELLAFEVHTNSKGDSCLVVNGKDSALEIKGLHSFSLLLDIFLGTMIMMREQTEGTLRQAYLAKAGALWIFEFKRTKTSISIKILEQLLEPVGEEHHRIVFEKMFKWKGYFEMFEFAVENLLHPFPKYKVFNLLGPKSEIPSA